MLTIWASEWQCSYNLDKCSVIHLGKRNLGFKYSMLDPASGERVVLLSKSVEKDLGVLISGDLRWGQQIAKVTKLAQFALSQIRNTFVCHDVEIIRPLYIALVRPHLEYAVAVWNPHLVQDSNMLERIQRRAT